MEGVQNKHFENEELIMFYNAENFFSPDNTNRQQLSISGLRSWNRKKYENKIFKIAHVFQLVNESNELPMLIGLSEVQGEKVLQDLVEMDPFNSNFGIVHYESMDERGVDVALLYDKRKIEIIESEPISFFFEIKDDYPDNYDTTRDILYCKAKYQNAELNIFVFHLPSKRENDINRPKRQHMLKTIKERIETMTGNNEAVILCGDFNENPDEENLLDLVNDRNGGRLLQNPFEELFRQKRYSTFHYRFGLLFDQIMLSKDFMDGRFPLQFASAEVFNHEKISNWDRKFKGRPFRTYAGTRYLGGYSDHFPVFVKLKNIKN